MGKSMEVKSIIECDGYMRSGTSAATIHVTGKEGFEESKATEGDSMLPE